MTSFTLKNTGSNGWLGEDGYFKSDRFTLFIARDKFAVLTDNDTDEVFNSTQWFGDILEFPNAEICVAQWEATLTLRKYDIRISLNDVSRRKAYGQIIYERYIIIQEDGMNRDEFLEWTNPIKDLFEVGFIEEGSAIHIVAFREWSSANNKPRIREAIQSRIANYLWS